MPDKTPFDCWWGLYSKYCPRMDKKSKCEKLFVKFNIGEQRVIYQDTIDRVKHYEDWQAISEKGKRKFMRGPHPYLLSEMWECPVDKGVNGNVRDTTNEQERPEQKIAGLKKMRETLVRAGLDTGPLDSQIAALAN